MIGVVVYSLAVSLSEKENAKIYLTNMEIGWSLGKIIGPIIGAICFRFGGYILPFTFLGMILFISLLLVNKINLKFQLKEEINENEDKNKKRNDEIGNFVYSAEAWIILFGFVIGIVVDCYFYPCLTYHLTYNYGLSISFASLFFTVPIIVYIIAVGILNNYQNNLGIYIAYTLGLIFTALGPLFVYPITIIPKNIFFVLFGLILIGVGQAPIFVQGFVLLTNIIKKINPNKDEITLNDISSTLNNITIDIGGFIGPIIGGFLTTKYNFNICCFIIFFVSCVYLIIFFVYFYKDIKSDLYLILSKKEDNQEDNSNEKELLIKKNNEEL
jgi:MFS family permease